MIRRKNLPFLFSVLISGLLLISSCAGSAPTSQSTETAETAASVAAKGPVFTVSSLLVMPAELKMHDSVSITVLVTNSGDATGSYTVNFEVNGKLAASKDITLDGGTSGTVSFKTSQDSPGNYQVNVNGCSGTFTVIPPPSALPTKTPPPPSPTPSPTPTPTKPSDWTIPTGSGTNFRAVHMGGNWGTNRTSVINPPEDYLMYLRDLNVNWVGISVALHVDGSMDSTVELDYDESLPIPTFKDEVLRNLISTFKRHGFNVYLAMAFEGGNTGEHPVSRWQLGDPLMHTEDPNILPEFWPWRTDHPQHQTFVAEFWQSYTDSCVHIAQIAEEEGAGMMCLGTETDRLFRSRSSGRWTNNFLTEMKSLVAAVRNVYHGQIGYDMHYQAITDAFYDAGSDNLVADLALDYIGVSAYFELMPSTPTSVPSVQDLESRWNAIFNENLKPLKERNGNKPVIFTEFGYVDSLAALHNAAADEYTTKVFKDSDGNGKDDGEEAQANAYAALFNTMDKFPGMVSGAFLWDVMMVTARDYQQNSANKRAFNIRLKLAEAVVREQYEEWR